MNFKIFSILIVALNLFSLSLFAEEKKALVALSGYDPVAYFSDQKAVRGSGFFAHEYQGVTYLFSSEEHKEQFIASPSRYLPAYGGYCAFGVALGKKFHSDPRAWKIVEGKLYLNLNSDIQKKWVAEQDSMISKADQNWKTL